MIGTGSFQSKTSTENVVNIVDNHKRVGVNFAYDATNFCSLGKFGNYEKDFPLTMGVSTFAVEVGYATTNNFDNCFCNGFGVITDDDNVLFEIEADNKCVTGFVHYEHGQQGVEHRLDTEKEAANKEQEDIEDKVAVINADGIIFLDDGTHNIHTATATTNAIH